MLLRKQSTNKRTSCVLFVFYRSASQRSFIPCRIIRWEVNSRVFTSNSVVITSVDDATVIIQVRRPGKKKRMQVSGLRSGKTCDAG